MGGGGVEPILGLFFFYDVTSHYGVAPHFLNGELKKMGLARKGSRLPPPPHFLKLEISQSGLVDPIF